MAKRYTRINYQDSPSTATPLSAANLNKMDKGIKDCDDAIGDLALLTTNNKTDLVSAINEQNNNLVQYMYAYTLAPITVTSEGELTAALSDDAYPAYTPYRKAINITTSGLSLPGGRYYLEGYNAYGDHSFGWQKLTLYDASGIIIKMRSKMSGTWTAWVDK